MYCHSNKTTLLVSRKFKVFGSLIMNNTASYGGFATFKASKKSDKIEFDVGATTIVQGNSALIAGGKFFLIEPVNIIIQRTDHTVLLETKSCNGTVDKNQNSAGCYGPEAASTTTKFDTSYPPYIYPEQIFKVSVRRYDRFGQFVNQEVDSVADTSTAVLRMVHGSLEGNKTFVNGEVDFRISLSTRKNLETTTLMFSAPKYHVAPSIFNVTVAPVCPPGFQLVCC